MRHRHELTDTEWARLEPLLPPRQPGRPRTDDRLVVNGIAWKLATGAPWRDLPERYGPWQTVDTRFRRWTVAGTWDQIFAAVQRQADAAGQLDWQVHFVDRTVVRAHQHAAGAKGGPETEALGRSRSGFSTKVHLRAEGGGKPRTVLAPGPRHEATVVARLLEQGAVRRGGRRRPRRTAPSAWCATRVHRPGAPRRLPAAEHPVHDSPPAHRAACRAI